jgi:hypothetical protein
MIFMYLASFMLLGVQFSLGDVFGHSMKNQEGLTMRNSVLDIMDFDTFNSQTEVALAADKTNTLLDTFIGAATIGWDLFTLATGTYIFTLMAFFGVPLIFVGAIIGVYLILLILALMGIIRGS